MANIDIKSTASANAMYQVGTLFRYFRHSSIWRYSDVCPKCLFILSGFHFHVITSIV